MNKQLLIDEYLDLSIAREMIEDDDDYAKKIGYYTSYYSGNKMLCDLVWDRLYELQAAVLKTHPYFKKREPMAVWSLESEKLVMPFAKGKVMLTYEVHWGDPVDGLVLNDPTYLDMFAAADKLIRQSGDSHHVFVEDFIAKGKRKGVKVYDLSTGS